MACAPGTHAVHDGEAICTMCPAGSYTGVHSWGSRVPPPPPPAPSLPLVPASLSSTFHLSQHNSSMTVAALVMLRGVEQSSGTLTAFVGTAVRGEQDTSSTLLFGPYAGKSVFQIIVFASPELQLPVPPPMTMPHLSLSPDSPPSPLHSSPPPIQFNPQNFANSMTATALVQLGGVAQSSGTLTAIAGMEVRGLENTPIAPPFGPYSGQPLFSIILYGDKDGETVSFQFSVGGGTAALTETLVFAINGNAGSAVAPLTLTGDLAVPGLGVRALQAIHSRCALGAVGQACSLACADIGLSCAPFPFGGGSTEVQDAMALLGTPCTCLGWSRTCALPAFLLLNS